MITEDYCSFEVSKILKEKGFDEPCHNYYSNMGLKFDPSLAGKNSYQSEDVYSAPTHQMVMKWLREIYGIDIVIEISDLSAKDRKYYCIIWKNYDSYILDLFDSYEEAVEAALKHSLENLI